MVGGFSFGHIVFTRLKILAGSGIWACKVLLTALKRGGAGSQCDRIDASSRFCLSDLRLYFPFAVWSEPRLVQEQTPTSANEIRYQLLEGCEWAH